MISCVVQSSQIGKSTSRASIRRRQSLEQAMDEARKLRDKSPLPGLNPTITLPSEPTANILHVLKGINEEGSSRPMTPACGFSPAVSPGKIDKKIVPTVAYENEKTNKHPQPLIATGSSPPRVIKRKSPGASATSSNGSSNRPGSSVENINKSRPTSPPKTTTLRPETPPKRALSPGKTSKVGNIPYTTETNRTDDRLRLVDKAPAKYSPGKMPRRPGNWL